MVLASSIPVASDAVNKRSYLHNSSSNKPNIYIYILKPQEYPWICLEQMGQ